MAIEVQADTKTKKPEPSNSEPGKPLAPPPKPGSTDDYFGSLNYEPNPFEHSFGGGASNGGASAAETPGGTKLPSVASLTSPSSLLPGTGTTPFNWGGGSLRTDTHLRGGFPTPNESSMRTGLTPGGSGSMFPAASPNSQALFNQLASGVATPSTIDFHRTAMNAAAAKARDQGQNTNKIPQQPATSNPQEMSNGVSVKQESKAPSGPFDPHDNDAANGLFMLAQGRNGTAPANAYAVASQQSVHAHPAPAQRSPNTSPQMTNGNVSNANSRATRGPSEAGSAASPESDQARQNSRVKGKRSSTASATNGRRKAEETPPKQPPSKKAKVSISMPLDDDLDDDDDSSDDGMKLEDGQGKSKMTDEEKRKNFLERNRVAALKCRQRKKQWLANLQNKVEMFSSENDALTGQISQLREEVVNLKTLLLAHKDCPVTQQQGLHGAFMQQAMDNYNPQMNPYGMGAPIQNQPVLAGQGVQRRFS